VEVASKGGGGGGGKGKKSRERAGAFLPYSANSLSFGEVEGKKAGSVPSFGGGGGLKKAWMVNRLVSIKREGHLNSVREEKSYCFSSA